MKTKRVMKRLDNSCYLFVIQLCSDYQPTDRALQLLERSSVFGHLGVVAQASRIDDGQDEYTYDV